MIVEISCEVRDHVHRGKRQTFTTSVPSLALPDIIAAMQARFPRARCVHPKARVIDMPLPEQFNKTADAIARLEQASGKSFEELEAMAATPIPKHKRG